jgi:hypothetical protein
MELFVLGHSCTDFEVVHLSRTIQRNSIVPTGGGGGCALRLTKNQKPVPTTPIVAEGGDMADVGQ